MNQDPFQTRLFPIVIPDLGTGGAPVRLVIWLVPTGARVIPGERLAELLVQGTVFQLEAETEGLLEQRSAAPGDHVVPGETIGLIRLETTS